MDQMAAILKTLNQTAPDTSLDADPDDEWVWDDDFAGGEENEEEGDYDYYTGDDDWMSDELWY